MELSILCFAIDVWPCTPSLLLCAFRPRGTLSRACCAGGTERTPSEASNWLVFERAMATIESLFSRPLRSRIERCALRLYCTTRVRHHRTVNGNLACLTVRSRTLTLAVVDKRLYIVPSIVKSGVRRPYLQRWLRLCSHAFVCVDSLRGRNALHVIRSGFRSCGPFCIP